MDDASRQATKMLQALGVIRGRLLDFVVSLYSRPEVKSTYTAVQPERPMLYRGGLTGCEGSVGGIASAKLDNGKSVSWTVEVFWSSKSSKSWVIQTYIQVYENQLFDFIEQFPDREAETLDECIRQLDLATTDLINRADAIDKVL